MNQRPSMQTFRRDLALTAATVTSTFVLVAAALVFVPLFAHLDGGELGPEAMGGIAAYVLHLHASFWPVVGGALLASIVGGMVLFERMRAPLVRFARIFDAVGAGQVPEPLVLRASDYLQDEADALNAMLDSLGERSATLCQEAERIHQALCEIPGETLEPKVAAALDEAREAAGALRRQLDDDG